MRECNVGAAPVNYSDSASDKMACNIAYILKINNQQLFNRLITVCAFVIEPRER